MRRLNVLVMHNLESLERSRRSAADYVFALQRHASQHNYLIHRISLPVSEEIRRTPWDLVIFESTSVGICTYRPQDLFEAEKKKWAFLRDLEAVKIAFPQDDANCGRLMDDWFSELRIDGLFTVRPEFVDLIYPKTTALATVKHVYSGYLEDAYVKDLEKYSRPYRRRRVDVGQRVTMYPHRGGRQGRLKGLAAEAIRVAALRRGLKVDISTKSTDTLLGEEWYQFLGDCKHTVGAEGGLSIWDPYGDICDRIERYEAVHPGATFEEVEEACFPGLDGNYVFTGFSPRILEAAGCGCDQILVRGHYLGLLKPGVHYVSLNSDFNNVEEVLDAIRDDRAAKNRISACRETLVENPSFRFSTLVTQVMEFVEEKGAKRLHQEISASEFALLKRNHWQKVKILLSDAAARNGLYGKANQKRVDYLLNGQIVLGGGKKKFWTRTIIERALRFARGPSGDNKDCERN